METAPELEIERLVIEDDRPGHIARHDVTLDSVIAVLIGDYVAVPGKEGRYIVIGRDEKERFLAIVLGTRTEKGTYGLVTAGGHDEQNEHSIAVHSKEVKTMI